MPPSDSRSGWFTPFLMVACVALIGSVSCTQSTSTQQHPASSAAPVAGAPHPARLPDADAGYEFPLDQFPFENEILVRLRSPARITKQWPNGIAVVRCFVNITYPSSLNWDQEHAPGWVVIGYISHSPSSWIYLNSSSGTDCAVAIQTECPGGCTLYGEIPCTSITDSNGNVSETWTVDIRVIATRGCDLGDLFYVIPEHPYTFVPLNMLANTRGFLDCDDLLITIDPWPIADETAAPTAFLTQR